MSSSSYSTECPKCKNNMDCYNDSRNPESNYQICWHCGYELTLQWIENQMTKQELIDRRVDGDICDWEYEEYRSNQEKNKLEVLSFEEWTTRQVVIGAI